MQFVERATFFDDYFYKIYYFRKYIKIGNRWNPMIIK